MMASRRLDPVVPLSVERVGIDLDGGEIVIADGHALGVGVVVDLGAYLQAAARLGAGHELDDHLMADQRTAAPVHPATVGGDGQFLNAPTGAKGTAAMNSLVPHRACDWR